MGSLARRRWGCSPRHLAPEQPAEALAAAETIGDGKYRAHALGSFAAHLPREQIADCRQGA